MADAAAWDAWLAAHHSDRPGVWLKLAKKSSGVASPTTDEVVEVGLCWGWISGHRKGLDETYFLQRYTPRRPPQQLVGRQCRQSGSPHGRGSDARTRHRRSRRCQGRRTLGQGDDRLTQRGLNYRLASIGPSHHGRHDSPCRAEGPSRDHPPRRCARRRTCARSGQGAMTVVPNRGEAFCVIRRATDDQAAPTTVRYLCDVVTADAERDPDRSVPADGVRPGSVRRSLRR